MKRIAWCILVLAFASPVEEVIAQTLLPASVHVVIWSSYRVKPNGHEWEVDLGVYVLDEFGTEMGSGAEGYEMSWDVDFGGGWQSDWAFGWGITPDGMMPGEGGQESYYVRAKYHNASTSHTVYADGVLLQYTPDP